MPIDMGVLGYQQRSARQGEIRIGDSVEVTRNGKTFRQPKRLRTFKFTVPTEAMAQKIAELYGGEVIAWDRKEGHFAVVTPVSAIEVYVPVRGSVADSNMELWDGPIRKRWCDGKVERMSGDACKCPLDRTERERLSKLPHPEACKPRTKIWVTIPELPGMGKFQLSTASVNALEETGDASKAMEAFRDESGAWVPAVLRIDWRQRVGDASPYPVPMLEIGASLVQLARHELPRGTNSLQALLRASGPQPAAIEAGPAAAERETEAPAPVTDEVRQAAQQIADEARGALSLEAVRMLIHRARDGGLAAVDVCVGDAWMPLKAVLDDAWELAGAGDAG